MTAKVSASMAADAMTNLGDRWSAFENRFIPGILPGTHVETVNVRLQHKHIQRLFGPVLGYDGLSNFGEAGS